MSVTSATPPTEQPETIVRIALPSGRTGDAVVGLLAQAGLELDFGPERKSLKPRVSGSTLFEFRVVRAKDAGRLVGAARIDAAFIGRDIQTETCANHGTEVLLDTHFHPVSLAFAAPVHDVKRVRAALNSHRKLTVATKYRKNVERWASDNGHPALDILELEGSTEAYPGFAADCIADVVDTGSTLRANALESILEISRSTTLLVASRQAFADPKKQEMLIDLTTALSRVLRGRDRVFVDVNVTPTTMESVRKVLDGAKLDSLNVIPGVGGRHTLRIACPKSILYETMRDAEKAGGTSVAAVAILLLGKPADDAEQPR